MSDRFVRQRLLAAVGDGGQARIAAATYVASSDASLSSQVEREYLARAGAERFTPAGVGSASFAHAAAFRHADARDFAAGAWRALIQLRNALEHAP